MSLCLSTHPHRVTVLPSSCSRSVPQVWSRAGHWSASGRRLAVSMSASAATARGGTTAAVNRRLCTAGTATPLRAEGRGAGKRARPRSDADAAAEVMIGDDA